MNQPQNQPLSYRQAIELATKELAARPIGEEIPLPLMTAPPAHPIERDYIGDKIGASLLKQFESSLSESDRFLWHNFPERIESSPAHLRILHAFDDYLLRRIAELGWRTLLSFGVLKRISEWEQNNPSLLRRLGEELASRSEALRGESNSPWPEDMDIFADAAIPELEMLFRLKREKLGRHLVPCTKIAEWIQGELNRRPEEFPTLSRELHMLVGFVHNLPKLNPDLAQALERGNVSARYFFPRWFATSLKRSEKDLRNHIGGQRRERRERLRKIKP